jgi:magnesium chelatase family protein
MMPVHRLTTLWPEVTQAGVLETMRMHSVADLINPRTAVATTRPCGAPQQTISDVGLVSGARCHRADGHCAP